MNMLNDAIQTDTANNHEVLKKKKKRAQRLVLKTGQTALVGFPDRLVANITDPGSAVKPQINDHTKSGQFKHFFGDNVITENKKPGNFLQVLMSTSQLRTA